MGKPMPFLNNVFDVVYARLSLHYFTDNITRKIINDIFRVTRPNGFFCFMCKSTDDPLYGKGEMIEKDMFEYHGHIRHFFSENYVRELLKDKLNIITIKKGEGMLYNNRSAYIKVISQKSF